MEFRAVFPIFKLKFRFLSLFRKIMQPFRLIIVSIIIENRKSSLSYVKLTFGFKPEPPDMRKRFGEVQEKHTAIA